MKIYSFNDNYACVDTHQLRADQHFNFFTTVFWLLRLQQLVVLGHTFTLHCIKSVYIPFIRSNFCFSWAKFAVRGELWTYAFPPWACDPISIHNCEYLCKRYQSGPVCLPEGWQGIACLQSGSLLSYRVGANYCGAWPWRLRWPIGQESWRKNDNLVQRFLCVLFGFWALLRASKKDSSSCSPERKMGCTGGTGERRRMRWSVWIGQPVFDILERYIVIYFTSEEHRKNYHIHLYRYFLG